jgi:hypothetical protein
VPLSEEDVSGILPELFDLCETHRIPGTFFELTTALAFAKFQRAGCGAVVLEAGLGGRLDATNVVTPVLSIITSVQLGKRVMWRVQSAGCRVQFAGCRVQRGQCRLQHIAHST